LTEILRSVKSGEREITLALPSEVLIGINDKSFSKVKKRIQYTCKYGIGIEKHD